MEETMKITTAILAAFVSTLALAQTDVARANYRTTAEQKEDSKSNQRIRVQTADWAVMPGIVINSPKKSGKNVKSNRLTVKSSKSNTSDRMGGGGGVKAKQQNGYVGGASSTGAAGTLKK
jgi:hypothetical protein